MKKLNSLTLIIGLLLFISCSKDPAEIFPGAWNIDSGGQMYFNSDGTGYSVNSTSFWLSEGCVTADTIYYLWSAEKIGIGAKGTIRLDYLEADGVTPCSASSAITYRINSKDEIQLGEQILGVGVIDILTRQ
jgi:hypothetical protein